MTNAIQSENRTTTSSITATNNTAKKTDASAGLRAAVEQTPDVAADRVADRVIQDADAMERTGTKVTEVPPTEPTPANRAAADGFSDELQAIDAREQSVHLQAKAAASGDYRTANQMRGDVLGRIATHADGIKDLAERDRFVRAVAPDAGLAAGKLSGSSPLGAFRALDAIGKDVSPDTGRLLVNEALKVGTANDNLVPNGKSGSPVGDALVEARQGRTERLGEVLGGAARTIIPGVDAASNLIEGDVSGAISSAGVDLAGGAILRGGKLAVGAVVGAVALAPQEAEAGVLQRLTMRFGDEAVEVKARVGTAAGRARTFDVEVPGRFADGTTGALRLTDPRGKHNALKGVPDGNLSPLAKQISRGKAPEFGAARTAAQFSDRYNSVEGQAALARLVMERVTPAQLAQVGKQGGRLDIPLDRTIGLTPLRGGKVVPASSVRVMSNNDGAFHLVPMP